jgi:hypothetical protein
MKKIKTVLKQLLYERDLPDNPYGREWRWWVTTSRIPTFNISLEYQLVCLERKPIKPLAVAMYSFLFYLNPLKWRIESNHTYYDGPHCSWQIGPVVFYRHGFSVCNRCSSER